MTPSLPTYPAYKPSGIAWLDDAPDHWEVRRGGWLFHKMDRPVRDADEVITCFRDGRVTLRKNRRTEGFTESLKEIGYQGVRKGDLVIHQMDAFAGAVGVSDSDGKGTPVYSVCQPTQDANPNYYALIVREMARSQWILALAKGIRERSTDFRYSEFSKQPLPLPPLEEQTAIARYLDYVDRRVRRYVEAKRKLIALLEEERQAVIHQAVTRGLDPNVPLKPSGVEWLGDVPDHWMVNKTTRLFSIGSGTTPPTDSPRHYGGGIAWVTTSELRESVVTATKKTITRDALSEFPVLSIYPEESVAVAMYGATIGRIGILGIPATVNQACCVFTTKGQVLPWFWFYWLQARRPYLLSLGYGGGQPNLSMELLKAIRLPTPPLQEQVTIVDYLERAIANFDDAIARARRQIELVEEYRTRLIADVVTGKLDVRAAAAQLPDEADDLDTLEVDGSQSVAGSASIPADALE